GVHGVVSDLIAPPHDLLREEFCREFEHQLATVRGSQHACSSIGGVTHALDQAEGLQRLCSLGSSLFRHAQTLPELHTGAPEADCLHGKSMARPNPIEAGNREAFMNLVDQPSKG